MPSADSDHVVAVWGYHMKASLFPAFLPFIDAFEDQVRFLWFFNGDHFHFEIFTFSHHSWEGFFADLTLEFSKIVGDDHTGHFFLDFAVNPHLQALNMNTLARSFAFAWRNEEILIATVITKTEFACSCDLFFGLVHSIEFSKEKLFFFVLTFLWQPWISKSLDKIFLKISD